MFGELWHSANLLRKSLPFWLYNSGHEATAFGFRLNSRFIWTSNIRKTLGKIYGGSKK